MVEIYTDGACRGNPGPGGFAALLRHKDAEKLVTGAEPQTTNNRMELMAAIVGLEQLKVGSQVVLTTDSEYVRKGITQWLAAWLANGWRTSAKKAVKNRDLWLRLHEQAQRHRVEWRWVKGHSGHPDNERADRAANDAIDAMQAANQAAGE